VEIAYTDGKQRRVLECSVRTLLPVDEKLLKELADYVHCELLAKDVTYWVTGDAQPTYEQPTIEFHCLEKIQPSERCKEKIEKMMEAAKSMNPNN
jgi:hypothetical protein